MVGTTIVKIGNALPVLENGFGSKLDIDGKAVTASALPPGSSEPTRTHLVKATSRYRSLVRDKQDDEGGIVVGLESLNDLLRHDGAGHLCTGIGGNGVDEDIVLLALKSKGLGKTKNTALR